MAVNRRHHTSATAPPSARAANRANALDDFEREPVGGLSLERANRRQTDRNPLTLFDSEESADLTVAALPAGEMDCAFDDLDPEFVRPLTRRVHPKLLAVADVAIGIATTLGLALAILGRWGTFTTELGPMLPLQVSTLIARAFAEMPLGGSPAELTETPAALDVQTSGVLTSDPVAIVARGARRIDLERAAQSFAGRSISAPTLPLPRPSAEPVMSSSVPAGLPIVVDSTPSLSAAVIPLPAEVTSVPTRPVEPLPETGAIQTALGRYRNAFSVLDSGAAKAVWPTVDTKALGRAFDRLQDQDLEFENCEIAVAGPRAIASCEGSARYMPKVGNKTPFTEARQWKFNLRKIEAEWLIEQVDSR